MIAPSAVASKGAKTSGMVILHCFGGLEMDCAPVFSALFASRLEF